MPEPLYVRVQNRRTFRRYSLFCAINSSCYTQAALACVTVLLIVSILWIDANQLNHHSVIDLYRSHTAGPILLAARDNAMRLMITRDGTMYFRNSRIASENLPELAREEVKSGSPRKVFLVVDRRAKYWDVQGALEEVRRAGVWDVAFLTEAPVSRR